MKNSILFFYSDPDDALVKIAKKAIPANPNTHFVSIDRIIKYLHPMPWPQVITSNIPDDIKKLFDGAIIANRIFCFDPSLRRSDLMKYAAHEMWIHIALKPLLGRAKRLLHDVGIRGISRSLLPLNIQWDMMSNKEYNIPTPNFSFAFGAEKPDISKLNDPIQKSIWSIFDWREEKHLPKSEKDWHQFFVERPIGKPVVCHYLGKDQWITSPSGEPSGAKINKVNQIAEYARSVFCSDFGEILLYVEPNGTHRFYAFSPHMMMASECQSISQRLNTWVANVVAQPLNA